MTSRWCRRRPTPTAARRADGTIYPTQRITTKGWPKVMSTSEWYEGFAVREAAGHSPTYERLARTVAASTELTGVVVDLGCEQPRMPLRLRPKPALRSAWSASVKGARG